METSVWRSIGGARKLYQPTMNGDGGRSWPGSDALQKETRLSSSLRCSVRKGLSIPALASNDDQQLADGPRSRNDHYSGVIRRMSCFTSTLRPGNEDSMCCLSCGTVGA